MTEKRLHGRVALITGAAKGIGRSIALLFAVEGARVVTVDLSADGLKETVEEIDASGGEGAAVEADVSDADQVQEAFERTRVLWGPPDILVNDAGVHEIKSFLEITEDDWDRMIAVDLKSVYLCCREALPWMLRRKAGYIINIASDLGQVGAAMMVHYSSAKGGVIAFTKSLAREVGGVGIHVNAIAPGPIETDMLFRYPDQSNEELASLIAGRFGRPDEVAATALFLVLPEADYYHGQVLCPNGGSVV